MRTAKRHVRTDHALAGIERKRLTYRRTEEVLGPLIRKSTLSSVDDVRTGFRSL